MLLRKHKYNGVMEQSGQVISTSSSLIANAEVRIEALLEECVRTNASDLHL